MPTPALWVQTGLFLGLYLDCTVPLYVPMYYSGTSDTHIEIELYGLYIDRGGTRATVTRYRV